MKMGRNGLVSKKKSVDIGTRKRRKKTTIVVGSCTILHQQNHSFPLNEPHTHPSVFSSQAGNDTAKILRIGVRDRRSGWEECFRAASSSRAHPGSLLWSCSTTRLPAVSKSAALHAKDTAKTNFPGPPTRVGLQPSRRATTI